jgi:UDP-perosamine 4-acetyltransferase
MTPVIILGAGGHARVAIDMLRRTGCDVIAAVDADPRLHGTAFHGVPVIGDDHALERYTPAQVQLVNAIGNRAVAAGNSALGPRRKAFELFTARGFRFAAVVSPQAIVAGDLGIACHVFAGAIVQVGAAIGDNAIVNTGAQVDHDCIVGPHCHIASGAVVCGNVQIGAEAHIGAGAVVVHDRVIGAGAVIAAGAVVVADVPPGATVMGVPGRIRSP